MEAWLILLASAVVAALAVDHLGLLGLQPRPINLRRAAGTALMLRGVAAWLSRSR